MRKLTLATVVALAVALLTVACSPGPARLLVTEGTPGDVVELAEGVWDGFLAAFPAREDCIAPVTLATAWELSDRARYLPEQRTIVLRIPWTAPRLSQSLAHELGHHLEHTCPDQVELRSVFLAALGRDPGAPWFEGGSWEETPSELFAEAVSAVVLGDDTRVTLHLPQEAVQLVRSWGVGTLIHGPSAP